MCGLYCNIKLNIIISLNTIIAQTFTDKSDAGKANRVGLINKYLKFYVEIIFFDDGISDSGNGNHSRGLLKYSLNLKGISRR